MTVKALHFIYNVDANLVAVTKDFVHRIVDPETYPCRLCDITWGRFVKKPGWQWFLWSLPVKSHFYTRDVFLSRYPEGQQFTFPCVLAESADGELSAFICDDEFVGIANLDALKATVSERLAQCASRV